MSAGEGLPQDVEIAFEASGASAAIGSVLAATQRGGTVVQVGNLPGSEITALLGNIVTREINYLGSVMDLHMAGLFLDQKRFYPPFDFLAKIEPDLDQLQFGITAVRDS